MIYPWHKNQWQHLLQARANNQLAHAMLFNGPQGTGKSVFANYFASALLCQNISEQGENFCFATLNTKTRGKKNICHSCRLTETRAHADLKYIGPEKVGQAIKIDQIREINEFVSQTSIQGRYRIIIIDFAHMLNRNAANALLKTLEEPSSGAQIFLLSHQISKLPATVLSRCQKINFALPTLEQSLEWLQMTASKENVDWQVLLAISHGAPLLALEYYKEDVLTFRENLFTTLMQLKNSSLNPLAFCAKYKDAEIHFMFDFLFSWLTDLIRLKLNESKANLHNKDYGQQLQDLASSVKLSNLNDYISYLLNFRAEIAKGTNLNKQLCLENILIKWMSC